MSARGTRPSESSPATRRGRRVCHADLVGEGTAARSARHDQHRPGGTTEYSLGHGAFTQSAPSSATIRAKYDQVHVSRVCVQNDHSRRVAVLLINARTNAGGFSTSSQLG